jgi:hypothetical protein
MALNTDFPFQVTFEKPFRLARSPELVYVKANKNYRA